eukprot:gb/GECG01015422.1/.p1 GENE.gb/GECG01015422.1/~~gb/GECG01015422.1/.p1  ORF type:complete len:610 (+),score=64.09 gb/GECG01015422.1/:1-1830(+)
MPLTDIRGSLRLLAMVYSTCSVVRRRRLTKINQRTNKQHGRMLRSTLELSRFLYSKDLQAKKYPLAATIMHETAARVPCASITARVVPVLREQNEWIKNPVSRSKDRESVSSGSSTFRSGNGAAVPVDKPDQLLAPTRKSVPREEWEHVGLLVEPPEYSTGAYDSSRCRPPPAELALYPKRCNSGMITVRNFLQSKYDAAARSLVERANSDNSDAPIIRPEMTANPEQIENGTFGIPPPPESDDEVLARWVKMRLRGNPTKMIDYRFAVPFDRKEGIQISVDGVQNVDKRAGLIVVFHCMAPMCPLYSRDGDMKNVGMTIVRKWDSNQKHQAFEEHFVKYSNLPLDGRLTVILDVRSVSLSKISKRKQTASIEQTRDVKLVEALKPYLSDIYKLGRDRYLDHSLLEQYDINLEPYGWTLLPVLDIHAHGYVQRGAFRLPLMKGPPPHEVLVALRKGKGAKSDAERPYPLEILKRALESKEIYPPLEYTDSASSVLVRLNDSQFNGIVRIGKAMYKETYTLSEKVKHQIRAPLEHFYQGKSLRKKIIPKDMDEKIFQQTLNWKIVELIIKEMHDRKKRRTGEGQNYSPKESPDAPISLGSFRRSPEKQLI